MAGPPGFERFNTTADGPHRNRRLTVLSELRARLAAGPPGRLFSGPRMISGSLSLSSDSPTLYDRVKVLATIIVVLLIGAYLGPGIALGGSERPTKPPDSAGLDQYERESGADGEPDAALPPGTGEDRPHLAGPSLSGGPPGPSSSGSSEPSNRDPEDESDAAGGSPVSGDAEGEAGETFRGGSSPVVPVSYNAEPYCRTYERGEPVRASESRAVFPLPEEYLDSYDDTWGAARPQGGHEGTDLMSPTGTPLYAITDGTIVPVSGSNANGWNSLGGYTVMVRADHGIGPVKKGDLFYYAHMDRQSPLPIGAKVEAGDQVGIVGDTGEGAEGTRGKFPPHLHLGWYDTTGTASEAPSGAMNPYPLLEWLKRNGGTAAGGWGGERATAGYCDYQERVTSEPPAADEYANGEHDGRGQRPYAESGGSADLDTGSPDPRPSPVVKRTEERTSSSRAASHSMQSSSGARQERPQADRGPTDPTERRDPRPDSGTGSAGSSSNDERAVEGVEKRLQGVRKDEGFSGKPARSPERETAEPGAESSTSATPSGTEPEETRVDESAPDRELSPDKPPRPRTMPDPDEPEREISEPDGGGFILPVAFHDEDDDGVRDAGERDLSGWPVELERGEFKVTGKSGDRIGGLKPGTYRVTFDAARDYTRTTPGTIRVRVGEQRGARPSFGFVEPAEITVLVCGEDEGESPCDGEGSLHRWEVRLLAEKDRLVAEAEIGRDGKHRFPALHPGDYELIFAPREGRSLRDPESRELTVVGGDYWSVELQEEEPSPSAEQYHGKKPRELSVEIARHPEAGEDER